MVAADGLDSVVTVAGSDSAAGCSARGENNLRSIDAPCPGKAVANHRQGEYRCANNCDQCCFHKGSSFAGVGKGCVLTSIRLNRCER